MGFLKDMSKWLSGGKTKGDTVRQASIKLKVFNKRLLRQSKKLEVTAQQAKDKAIRLRREGDNKGSEFHARNHLQIKKQARAVDSFRTNLEGLQFKLEQASAVKDVANIMGGIQTSLAQLKSSLSLPQITEMMSSIDMDMEDFEVTQEIAAEGMEGITTDSAVSDADVKGFLGEIDSELQVEIGGELPQVSGGKISELEEELNRLREND